MLTTQRVWSTPAAKLVMPASHPQDDEWRELRRAGVGGSDAPSVLGDDPFDDGTAWHVWANKTGRYTKPVNNNMERGHVLEPAAVKKFTAETGITTRRCGLLRSIPHPIMQANVDRLTSDRGGLEIKTTTSRSVRYWPADGSCPPYYAAQAEHCIVVTGRTHWWVAVLVIDTWDLHVWRIELSEQRQQHIIDTELDFWEYVRADTPPPFEWEFARAAELRDRFPTDDGTAIAAKDPDELMRKLSDRRHLKGEADEIAKELKDIDHWLRALAGPHAEVRIGAQTAYTYKKVNGSEYVDLDALTADHPEIDLATYRKRREPHRALSVKKIKEQTNDLTNA